MNCSAHCITVHYTHFTTLHTALHCTVLFGKLCTLCSTVVTLLCTLHHTAHCTEKHCITQHTAPTSTGSARARGCSAEYVASHQVLLPVLTQPILLATGITPVYNRYYPCIQQVLPLYTGTCTHLMASSSWQHVTVRYCSTPHLQT